MIVEGLVNSKLIEEPLANICYKTKRRACKPNIKPVRISKSNPITNASDIPTLSGKAIFQYIRTSKVKEVSSALLHLETYKDHE